MMTEELRTGYQQFVDSYVWDTYFTITFRRPTSFPSAVRSYRYFLKYLNTPEHEFYKKFVHTFVVCESQGYREGVHIHALIKGIDLLKVGLLQEKCIKVFGQSLVEPYDYSLPMLASGYLASKCAGSTLDYWDYKKINSRFRGKT